MPITLHHLRRFAVAHSLFTPTTLRRALSRLGFVQADPIRAPARAQDLILRHRVKGYRAGDLERRYTGLEVAEDFFINYGFVTSSLQALMHPRLETGVPGQSGRSWPAELRRRASLLLEFVRQRGAAHPREVDEHFSHGTIKNFWGGSSNATTHLLNAMHYRGWLRVARRENGIRIYAVQKHGPGPAGEAESRASIDALVDAAVNVYAPLPGRSLSSLVRQLRFAVPQWQCELKSALERAKQRLAHTRCHGVEWYWSSEADAANHSAPDLVRLLAPFDPVVWDRSRFELMWGWAYRFEAYTPASKRRLGYYAMPLLWRDRVIGWGNLSVKNGKLELELGYVEPRPPREPAFKRELEAELERMKAFLGVAAR
jgi:uncharacterized protein YcaQ